MTETLITGLTILGVSALTFDAGWLATAALVFVAGIILWR